MPGRGGHGGPPVQGSSSLAVGERYHAIPPLAAASTPRCRLHPSLSPPPLAVTSNPRCRLRPSLSRPPLAVASKTFQPF
jgi:hypothetical protein